MVPLLSTDVAVACARGTVADGDPKAGFAVTAGLASAPEFNSDALVVNDDNWEPTPPRAGVVARKSEDEGVTVGGEEEEEASTGAAPAVVAMMC